MEALGDLLRWWQALSAHSRMTYAIVSVTVVVTLGIAIYQGYSRQRRQAEAAQLLESALGGYDYIASAQATFAVGPPEGETASPPGLSLQLRFQPASTLPHNWLDNLVTFVLHTVSGLRPADLLITDSHGEVLYAKGQPTSAAASMAAYPSPSAIAIPKPKAVFEIPIWAWGLAALIALALIALYLRRAGHGNQQAQTSGETATSRPPQLEQFFSELTAGQITSLAQGERPEVVAALLHHAPGPETASAARQQMNVPPGSLFEPTRPPREEILVSFIGALHARLAVSQNTLGNGGDHSE